MAQAPEGFSSSERSEAPNRIESNAIAEATGWYRTVDEYLERCVHEATPPRAGELAATLGVPPSTLSRRFSRATGVGLLDYIRSRKLTYAASLLMDTDGTVDDVGSRAGFGSRSSFYREFARSMKVSPARFRARDREQPDANRRESIVRQECKK